SSIAGRKWAAGTPSGKTEGFCGAGFTPASGARIPRPSGAPTAVGRDKPGPTGSLICPEPYGLALVGPALRRPAERESRPPCGAPTAVGRNKPGPTGSLICPEPCGLVLVGPALCR